MRFAVNPSPVGASLLAIGCEAVVKNLDSLSQESRSHFIASKLAPTGTCLLRDSAAS